MFKHVLHNVIGQKTALWKTKCCLFPLRKDFLGKESARCYVMFNKRDKARTAILLNGFKDIPR